jgi:hypothetical protein
VGVDVVLFGPPESTDPDVEQPIARGVKPIRPPKLLSRLLSSKSSSSLISFSQRFTTHVLTSSQAAKGYDIWKPGIRSDRPNRKTSEVVAVSSSGSSWRSMPKGTLKRPMASESPLPTGR